MILVLVSFVSVAVHVGSFTTISPVDELTHIDSLFSAPDPVNNGERISEEALREQACRGLAGYPSPSCSTPGRLDPTDFQEEGYNTGSVYTPLYYSLTKLVAVPLQMITGTESLVTTARLVGALWLAAGLLLTYHVGRRLGAPRASLLSILVLVAMTPSILFPSATVSPDATGLVAGAAIIWAALVWEDAPRRRWWVPVLVAALVAALKTVNILGIFMIACYILIRLGASWYAQHRGAEMEGQLPEEHRRPILLGSLGVGAAVGATLVGWSAFVSATAVASSSDAPMVERTAATTLTAWDLLVSFGQFLNPLDGAGNVISTETVGFVAQRIVGMLLLAAVVGGALFALGSPRLRALAQAMLVAGAVGGPLMTVFIFALHGANIAIPGRYAIKLVPAGVVLAAAFVRTRWAQVVLGAGAALIWMVTLRTLLV